MSTNSTNGDYRIDRLSSVNLTDLEKLYTAVYKKLPAAEFFSRKYDTAFTGVIYTGFIAYDAAQLPIAFYGVIPCFIRFEDQIILAAQSADTMTHPQYRNKGLFVELALLTFHLCHSEGIKILFGFPNQNSLPGFVNKLNWQIIERMDCFIIPTGSFTMGRLFKKLPIIKKIHAAYCEKSLKKYLLPQQGIENSVFADGFAGVLRDYQYLKYKTYNITQVIKLDLATLWIKVGNELLIGDVSVSSDDFDKLMTSLKKLSRKLGLKEMHFHSSPGTTLHTLFAEHFNAIPSFPIIFLDLACGGTPSHKIKFTTADIDTF